MSRVIRFVRSEFNRRSEGSRHGLARVLVAMKSLARSSCSVMCGKPSQQARMREMACVRNKLFSLARIACNESQSATTVTSGDSNFPEANAKTPRYPPCFRAKSTMEDSAFWKS